MSATIPEGSLEKHLVISGLGPDRTGIVAEVTHYITERGGNIEDSRMAVLGGEFGVMMLVSGDGAEIGRIGADIAGLEKQTGLSIVTRETKSAEEHRKVEAIPCLVLCEA